MEELIDIIKNRIDQYNSILKQKNLVSYKELMECHKLACKIEALQDVLVLIDYKCK